MLGTSTKLYIQMASYSICCVLHKKPPLESATFFKAYTQG